MLPAKWLPAAAATTTAIVDKAPSIYEAFTKATACGKWHVATASLATKLRILAQGEKKLATPTGRAHTRPLNWLNGRN